jgi:hypothetical protein
MTKKKKRMHNNMKRKHRIQATCGQEKQGLSGLQKAPHLQDLIKYHLEDSEY